MRRSFRDGLTLTEVMMALGIASLAMLGLSQLMGSISGQVSKVQIRDQMDQNTTILLNQTRKYFQRGVDIAFTSLESISDSKPFHRILGSGGAVLRADLRPCSTFDPATSASFLNHVVFQCCEPQAEVTLNRPEGGQLRSRSVCAQPGLSIRVLKPDGTQVDSTCHRGIRQWSVIEAGVHQSRRSSLYQWVFERDSALKTGASLSRLQLYEALGNQRSAAMTPCMETLSSTN